MLPRNELGIGEATLRRWLREDDEFKKQYLSAREEVFAQALNQLRQGALEAVAALREIVADREASLRVRVSASQAIVKSLLKGMGMEKVVPLLCDLKKALVIVRFGEQDKDL